MEVLILFMTLVGGMIGMVVVETIVIAAHEFGHLAVGFQLGLRWEELKIGPFVFSRRGRGEPHYSHGWFYGYVLFDDSAATKRELTWVLLAGPVSSIVFAVVLNRFEQSVHLAEVPRFAIIAISIMSMLTAIINMLPFRLPFMLSDGYQLYRLYRKSTIISEHPDSLRDPDTATLPPEDLPESERVDIRDLPRL